MGILQILFTVVVVAIMIILGLCMLVMTIAVCKANSTKADNDDL